MSADGTNLGRWDAFQLAGAESDRLERIAEEEERERYEGPERTDEEADEALALIAAAVPADVAIARVRTWLWEARS